MNKKGTLLMYGLLIAIIIGLGVFFLYNKAAKIALQGGFDGKVQLELINASIAAEKEFLFTDIAAKYAAADVLREVKVSDGGCGEYMGFSLVNSYSDDGLKECFVDFEKDVTAKLNTKLKGYGVNREYDISFLRGKMIGKTSSLFEVNVGKGVIKNEVK